MTTGPTDDDVPPLTIADDEDIFLLLDKSPDNVKLVLPLDLVTELLRTCRQKDVEPSDAVREAIRRWCTGSDLVHHTDLGAHLDRHWDDITKAVNAAIDWYSDIPRWHSNECTISECYHCQN